MTETSHNPSSKTGNQFWTDIHLGKVWWGKRYLHSFKVLRPKILINYKKKKGNFTMEKPDRLKLNQVIKCLLSVMGQTKSCVTRVQHHFCNIPAKDLTWIEWRGTWDNSKLRTIQNKSAIIFKNVRSLMLKPAKLFLTKRV